MGAFNIEILHLLTLHRVLCSRDSIKRNKGVIFIKTTVANIAMYLGTLQRNGVEIPHVCHFSHP